MKKLSRKALSIPTRPVEILQFGYGNFLRGFADWMVEIANNKNLMNAGIQAVQIHSENPDPRIRKQEGLFHVISRGISQGKLVDEAQLITSVNDVLVIFQDYEAYLKLGENPDLKFVFSNTTESGIEVDRTDLSWQTIPSTFPGKLTALLFRRFQYFKGNLEKGLIFLPSELIEKNGEKLKESILEYIKIWSLPGEFESWINSANTFCNTLVDRIVPGFPGNSINEIQEQIGFEDDLLVVAEPFHLWVIEAPEFVKTKFPLHKAGLNVKFVEDLSPYRQMKVRILNGAHTTLVPYAYLHGLRTVGESIENEEMQQFIRKAIFEEILDTLDLPKEELESFAEDVLERFANPFIRHELQSIALNSIAKFKVRVLPSMLQYWEKNQKWPESLCRGFAALLLFYKGEFKGEKLPLKDDSEVLSFFAKAWKKEHLQDVLAIILANQNLWGRDLSRLNGLSFVLETEIRKLLI